jgi:hypothetical protein
MSTLHAQSGTTGFPADELSRLELSIAQRADRLARLDGAERGKDLQHWLQAEREVFALTATTEKSVSWSTGGPVH